MASESIGVTEAMPGCPVDSGLIVPPGYDLSDNGVIQASTHFTAAGEPVEKRHIVALAPVVISERLIDVNDGHERLEVQWLRDGRWKEHTADRAAIMDTRQLVGLSAVGLPVYSGNAKELQEYLVHFEVCNLKTLPLALVSSNLGWQGRHGEAGFLWGRTLIDDAKKPAGNGISFEGSDEGGEEVADGFIQSGSFDGWLEGVAPIADHPRVLLGLYASLASPLLLLLGCPNFVVDWCGPTSRGKTTTLRVAASVWGNPIERSRGSCLFAWDSTRVWIERAAAMLNGLPLILDDTKRAKKATDVAQTLYDFAGGQGRGRGSIKGTRRRGSWASILLSSGEAPAVSFTQDGGTVARCLEVWGSPFGRADENNAELVARLNLAARDNFGWAGPEFVQVVLDSRQDWEGWRSEYRRVQAHYVERAGSNSVGIRYAEYVGLIDVAARLATAALELPWGYRDVIDAVWDDLLGESVSADRAVEALRLVSSWAQSHPSAFYARLTAGNQRDPAQGWAGRWESSEDWEDIAFFPGRLETILRDGGFEPEPILRAWKDRAFLDCSSDTATRRTKRVRIDREPVWCIVIRRIAIEEAGG